MIGKPISSDEFGKVLERQTSRDKFVKQMEEELEAIKPGECLLYEAILGAPLWVSVGLAILVGRVKGLKVIEDKNCTYVYREK